MTRKNKLEQGAAAGATMLRAIASFQKGHLNEAESLALQVAHTNPENPEVNHMLGVIAASKGQYVTSAQMITRAIQSRPKYAEAIANRGNVYVALGRLGDALADYDEVLTINPAWPEVHIRRGNVLWEMGRQEDALDCYERVIQLDPNHATGHFNRGNALRVLDRKEEALQAYRHAINAKPDYVEAYINLGTALLEFGKAHDACQVSAHAILIFPSSAEAFNLHGNILTSLARMEEALMAYERAIQINPAHVDALANSGAVLFELGKWAHAKEKCRQALDINPNHENAQNCYIYSVACACDWDDIDQLHRRVSDGIRSGTYIVNPFIGVFFPLTAYEQLDCAKNFIRSRFATTVEAHGGGLIHRHNKIRLGYLSADFNCHATAHLMAGLFELHDRSMFEVIAFSYGKDVPGDMHDRLRNAFDRFIDIRQLNDDKAAKLIRSMEIDIAIDLKGFTKDSRPGILARKPAPVQVNYLGFPGTTGADFIDYIVVDHVVAPIGHEAAYSEKLVYLPECYQVNDSKRKMSSRVYKRSDCGLPDEGFVFCCFNNNYKLTLDVFRIWMRLLNSVDGSVLWLLEGNELARKNLRRHACDHGVEPDRLVFALRMSVEDHLARHRLADLFLDTLPCNAHTTASDALWAGLPVLTCIGETFAGRVAASLLQSVWLPELVVGSLAEYESLALKLANDPLLLGELRARLDRNRLASPLFDTDRFRTHLETAYAQMLSISHQGDAPRAFSVVPLRK